jgi:hypothetical protein
MSLFKRSVVSEIANHFSVVLSTLIVVWLSVVLVRLLGEAAAGRIGSDVVVGLATFTLIAALPIILTVSIFIGVLTTVTRNYRESEMVVWFSSGLSLANWVNPVLRIAIPIAVLISFLTLYATPWANRQIGEYRARFEMRSDLSKITNILNCNILDVKVSSFQNWGLPYFLGFKRCDAISEASKSITSSILSSGIFSNNVGLNVHSTLVVASSMYIYREREERVFFAFFRRYFKKTAEKSPKLLN